MMVFGAFVMGIGVGAVIVVFALLRDSADPEPRPDAETPREDIIA